MGTDILIIGSGKLGSALAAAIAPRFPECNFYLSSRSADLAVKRANLASYYCILWGVEPNVYPVQLDILQAANALRVVRELKPSLIVNTTTPFPWWKINQLPAHLALNAHNAGPGVWCALDALLPYKLAKVIEQCDFAPVFINACYPDATNCFTSSLPGAPALGVGNLSNLVPALKIGFSRQLKTTCRAVDVLLVAHHYVSLNGPNDTYNSPAPYFLEIKTNEEKFTYSSSTEPFAIIRRHAKRIRGWEGQIVTTGSAAQVVSEVVAPKGVILHCPGPRGRIGGFPVKVSASGVVKIILPENLKLSDAEDYNRAAQVYDGIKEVKPGLIIPTDEARSVFNEICGFLLPDIDFDNVEDLAQSAIESLNDRYSLGVG